MSTETTPLKKLPYSVTKQGLMNLYLSNYTEKEIREGINTIIAEMRGFPASRPVFVKRIRHNELIEFTETYGLPEGYKY